MGLAAGGVLPRDPACAANPKVQNMLPSLALKIKKSTLLDDRLDFASSAMRELSNSGTRNDHVRIAALTQTCALTPDRIWRQGITDAYVIPRKGEGRRPRRHSLVLLPPVQLAQSATIAMGLQSLDRLAGIIAHASRQIMPGGQIHETMRALYFPGGMLFVPKCDFEVESRIVQAVKDPQNAPPLGQIVLPRAASHHDGMRNLKAEEEILSFLEEVLSKKPDRPAITFDKVETAPPSNP